MGSPDKRSKSWGQPGPHTSIVVHNFNPSTKETKLTLNSQTFLPCSKWLVLNTASWGVETSPGKVFQYVPKSPSANRLQIYLNVCLGFTWCVSNSSSTLHQWEFSRKFEISKCCPHSMTRASAHVGVDSGVPISGLHTQHS